MAIDLNNFRTRRYKGGYYIHFDKNYSFRKHFGHKTNTKIFPHYKNLVLFLEQNPNVKIYFTLNNEVKTFVKVKNGFLINMKAYTSFCDTVSNSHSGKVTAFLGQNLGINDISISEDDGTNYILQNATENHVSQILKGLNNEAQIRLLSQLSELAGTKSDSTHKDLSDLSGILAKIHEVDSHQLEVVINKTNAENKVTTIVKTLSQAELKNVSGTYKHDLYKSELLKLKDLLKLEETGDIVTLIDDHSDLTKYKAKQPEKIFQNWIEQNLWIFGIEYVKKYDARRIGFFSDSDLLMESMDGFLDLIELKRPKLKTELLKYDASHKSYFPSSDLSAAIGQSLYYLRTLEDFKLNVEKAHKAQVIMPRVKIIAGRTKEFSEEQFSALRVLNSNLNRIQVVSYDYLLSCGTQIIKSYEDA